MNTTFSRQLSEAERQKAMDDFAAQVRAINAESKAAVEAGAPAVQRLAKCFAGAPADAGGQARLLRPLLCNLYRGCGTSPFRHFDYLTADNRDDFAAVALALGHEGFPDRRIREEIKAVAGEAAFDWFCEPQPEDATGELWDAGTTSDEDGGIEALARIADAVVCEYSGQAFKIRAILWALCDGGEADLSDLMALDWKLRKDLCTVLRTISISTEDMEIVLGAAAERKHRPYEDGYDWLLEAQS